MMNDVDDEEPALKLRSIAPGRSCIACRRRKIKCDRDQPCGYCKKLKARCHYPDSEQSEKRSSEDDILTKLARIEAMLARLETRHSPPDQQQSSRLLEEPGDGNAFEPSPNDRPADQMSPASGKLLVEKEESRYVDGGFWTKLDEENSGEDPDLPASRDSELANEDIHDFDSPEAVPFASTLSGNSYAHLHPPAHQVFSLWQLFIDRVDPLLKIVHVPTTQRSLLQASSTPQDVAPTFESLMFAIYYAAVSSMGRSPDNVERQGALRCYRSGLQHALARSKLLSKPHLYSLQALTLYLICARPDADRTYIWSMTGLVIRLATKLGLHQDPATLGLKPYIAEMRRRLWWQIVILDVLTAEENDMDPALHEQGFDTKMPSNLNDQDLDSSMTIPAPSGNRRTEMIFALQRIEISYAARKILFSAKFTADNGYQTLSTEKKSLFIESLHRDLELKYYRHCDPHVPLCALTTTAASLVLSRMRLTVHSSASGLASSLPLGLMRSCIDVVEGIQFLRAHEIHRKWIWLFQRYVEWDAVAFLLNGLVKSECEDSDKIWNLVRKFWNYWEHQIPPGSIRRRWHRLESLRRKAEGLTPSATGPLSQEKPVDCLALQPHSLAQSYGAESSNVQGVDGLTKSLYNWQQGHSGALTSSFNRDQSTNSSVPENQALAMNQSMARALNGWNAGEDLTGSVFEDPSWSMELDEFHMTGW